MSSLSVKAFTQNFASAKSGWTSRSSILANRIFNLNPDVVFCAELYAAQRDRMVSLLSSKYHLVASYKGRCVFVKEGIYKKVSGSDKQFDLPNAKSAAGAKVQHIATGKYLNLVAVHTTWQWDRESYRAAEVKSVIGKAKVAWPHNRTIYGGDWNDSLKFGQRTGDAVGHVFASYGYRDLYNDVSTANRHNEEYNSANQFDLTPPQDGIHLDRIFGGDVRGTSWKLDHYVATHTSDYGSDHYGVEVVFNVPLP